MGLYVETLENVPTDENVSVASKRDYYVYLLDYGWDEPISKALMDNYEKMASIAAGNRAVVIRGTKRVHFEDEVLSWHNINGEDATTLLPAILITNRNPHTFREIYNASNADEIEDNLRLILIPLKKFCRNATQVVHLIEQLFSDIKQQKALKDFRVAAEVRKDNIFAMADLITLEPDNSGSRIPIESVINYLRSGKSTALKVEKTVFRIHFEDRSGIEFERLVYAYLYRLQNWDKLEWLGQSGGDGGKDIWGVLNGATYCYQCANYQSLVFNKIKMDIDKLVNGNSIPDYYYVVCGGRVSTDARNAISNYANQFGIKETYVWSGVEFEERLRSEAPELLRRFVDGEIFPEFGNE